MSVVRIPNVYDGFRVTNRDLPFALVELLIAGIVVGTRSWRHAQLIADCARVHYIREQENVDGAGI